MNEQDPEFTREILRKVRQIEIRSNQMVSEVFAGSYHSAFKGQGIDFEEVREYQPGDEVRTIDWNVTAKTGVPYVKQYREEENSLSSWPLIFRRVLTMAHPRTANGKNWLSWLLFSLFQPAAMEIKLAFFCFQTKPNSIFLPPKGRNMSFGFCGKSL